MIAFISAGLNPRPPHFCPSSRKTLHFASAWRVFGRETSLNWEKSLMSVGEMRRFVNIIAWIVREIKQEEFWWFYLFQIFSFWKMFKRETRAEFLHRRPVFCVCVADILTRVTDVNSVFASVGEGVANVFWRYFLGNAEPGTFDFFWRDFYYKGFCSFARLSCCNPPPLITPEPAHSTVAEGLCVFVFEIKSMH